MDLFDLIRIDIKDSPFHRKRVEEMMKDPRYSLYELDDSVKEIIAGHKGGYIDRFMHWFEAYDNFQVQLRFKEKRLEPEKLVKLAEDEWAVLVDRTHFVFCNRKEFPAKRPEYLEDPESLLETMFLQRTAEMDREPDIALAPVLQMRDDVRKQCRPASFAMLDAIVSLNKACEINIVPEMIQHLSHSLLNLQDLEKTIQHLEKMRAESKAKDPTTKEGSRA